MSARGPSGGPSGRSAVVTGPAWGAVVGMGEVFTQRAGSARAVLRIIDGPVVLILPGALRGSEDPDRIYMNSVAGAEDVGSAIRACERFWPPSGAFLGDFDKPRRTPTALSRAGLVLATSGAGVHAADCLDCRPHQPRATQPASPRLSGTAEGLRVTGLQRGVPGGTMQPSGRGPLCRRRCRCAPAARPRAASRPRSRRRRCAAGRPPRRW